MAKASRARTYHFKAESLTVGKIAEKMRPLTPDTAATTERIRHWTREGLLAPVEQHHAGTGRHRRYDKGSVLDAAILSVVADAGLHITSHRYLQHGLALARRALRKWEAGKSRGDLFLELAYVRSGAPQFTVHEGAIAPQPTARLSIFINLAQIALDIG